MFCTQHLKVLGCKTHQIKIFGAIMKQGGDVIKFDYKV